jgi:hypothetical protein
MEATNCLLEFDVLQKIKTLMTLIFFLILHYNSKIIEKKLVQF